MSPLPALLRGCRRGGLVLLAALVASCGGDSSTTTPDDGDDIASVTVSPLSGSVDIGGTLQLTSVVKNERGETVTPTVSWTSETAGVASVDPTGLVSGVTEGTAVIRASAGGRSGQAAVAVTDPNPPAAPSGVTALAVSDGAVDLGWTDNASNEDGFRIDREAVVAGASGAEGASAAFVEIASVGANVTTHRDTDLAPATQYRYRIRACNDNGCQPEGDGDAGATSSVVLTHATLAWGDATLPNGSLGVAYSGALTASGGDGTFTWRVSAGALPDGLNLDASTGVLTGAPTATGSFSFTIEVSSGEQTVSRAFTVDVTDAPVIATTSLPDGVVGTAYGEDLEATGGDGTFTWAVVDGSLPPGLTLGAAGSIAGTPSASGAYAFTVEVTSGGLAASSVLSITVHGALEVTTAGLPDGVTDQAYAEALAATGGDGSYAWSVLSGALPPGLGISGTGAISGTPTTAGTSTFTVQVVSGDGQQATAGLSLTVSDRILPPEVTTSSLAAGVLGVPYSSTLGASGGDGTYAWSLAGGALPGGVSLSSGGVLSGTPTATGTSAFTVEVASAGMTARADLSLTVTAGAPVVTTASLPDGELGVAYGQTLAATGGDGSYAWTITQGALPAGLTLAGATGVVEGTPTALGTFGFTVRVTSAGQTAERAFQITIAPADVVLETDYLIGASSGESYSDGFEATGGDGSAYAYAVTAGSLPTGLGLNPVTGALTGTPSTAGVFYFTVEASSAGRSHAKTYALWISPRSSGVFNLAIVNVAAGTSIPSASVVTALEQALDRWERVITGDLGDITYVPDAFSAGSCSGDGPRMNGQTFDDMVIMVNLAHIDGPGGTLASARPCDGRVVGTNINTRFGRLTLDTSDLDNLSDPQAYAVAFHEIGHIVGIGTWWSVLSQVGGVNLITGQDGADPRYTGALGNGFYTTDLGGGASGVETRIPIEADGGVGTRHAHWDEGEFDNEIMTGWIENNGGNPLSGMTIAAVGDLAYTVDSGAADAFTLPVCAPNCTSTNAPSRAPGEPGAGDIFLGDDIAEGPVTLELPDGRRITLHLGGSR